MDTAEIKNLIKELIEKTNIIVKEISITEDLPHSTWFNLELNEPHFYINREGEGLFALNHIVRKIVETKIISTSDLKETNKPDSEEKPKTRHNVLIDINGFQKKRIDGVKAIAHMMAERARYFKSNIEVDPMSSFERRIVHEFLSNEDDLKTESTGFGLARRVVIKYISGI
jgi:predicted RNA-binding protein Jag